MLARHHRPNGAQGWSSSSWASAVEPTANSMTSLWLARPCEPTSPISVRSARRIPTWCSQWCGGNPACPPVSTRADGYSAVLHANWLAPSAPLDQCPPGSAARSSLPTAIRASSAPSRCRPLPYGARRSAAQSDPGRRRGMPHTTWRKTSSTARRTPNGPRCVRKPPTRSGWAQGGSAPRGQSHSRRPRYQDSADVRGQPMR